VSVACSAVCTLTTIVGALIAGYLARRAYGLPDKAGTRITQWAVRYLQSFAVFLVLWGLDISDRRAFLLPFVGAVMASLSGMAGWGGAQVLRLQRRQAGAFVGEAMFSNIGLTHGAFVCFVVMGERGAALASLYVSFFLAYFFTIGVTVGRAFGRDVQERSGNLLRDTIAQPTSRNPLLGVVGGLALNLAGVQRAAFLAPVAALAIPLSVSVLLFGIGMTMRLSALRRYIVECLALSVVKFVISPLLSLLIALALGLFTAVDRALLHVVFIESFAPGAIYGLVLASMFDLDQDLANACWLFTNIVGIALIPIVIFLTGLL